MAHSYSIEEMRVIVLLSLYCFTYMYLLMRLAGVTLAVEW